MTTTSQRVTSTDGATLALYETGEPGRPAIVAVHGYPDDHSVWDGVAGRLADDFRVVTYDVRGAGASDKPGARSAYRIPQLVDDLLAVLDAVRPDGPVHLLGHDWGAVQLWPAIGDPRLAGRVAGFTSISGPSLDHAGAWLRDLAHHPRAAVRQLLRSYYVGLFQLPGLPEAVAHAGGIERAVRRAGRRTPDPRDAAARRSDAAHGVSLYRANLLGRSSRPRPVPVRIPVQVIVPERDAFVTPQLATGAPRPWVADLTVRRVPGGHWVITEQPEVVARLVRDFARRDR